MLGYFGETLEHPCGNCNRCDDAAGQPAPSRTTASPCYSTSTATEHCCWPPSRSPGCASQQLNRMPMPAGGVCRVQP
ncbi:hypothetical protein [Mycolicibacterium sp.]|uniref:hypothetical protein n=1 Tax=Mycolicibacterium sp. TaxID=2320850 RepID=UPI0028AD8DC7|nr:hypothetical protein [Mycolicibacterium sp.]